MAGIGFELRKIYHRNTLLSSVAGVIYSAFIVAGPTVVFTLLMLLLNRLMVFYMVPAAERGFFVSSFTHAFMVALLLSVILSSVLSRYISDMIFQGDNEAISASIWGVLTVVSGVSGAMMLGICIRLYLHDHTAPDFLLAYYLMGVLAAISYSMMTYISALKEYKTISLVFVAGVVVSALVLVAEFQLGWLTAEAIYIAMICGFCVIDVSMVVSCIRRFGPPDGSYFGFLLYFRKYPGVFISGALYGIGFYLTNVVYWFFSEMQVTISVFPTAPNYDRAMFLAIFINLPSLIIFSIFTETGFFEKYVEYLSAINGGKLRTIEKTRRIMLGTIARKLFFVYDVQLAITLGLVLFCVLVFPFWGVNMESMAYLTVLAFGVYSTMCMYYTMTILYYFDDGLDAAWTSAIFLAVEVLLLVLVLTAEVKLYCLPMLAAGLSGWLFAYWRLVKLSRHLDGYIMCRGGN